jgi:hypothetical protein
MKPLFLRLNQEERSRSPYKSRDETDNPSRNLAAPFFCLFLGGKEEHHTPIANRSATVPYAAGSYKLFQNFFFRLMTGFPLRGNDTHAAIPVMPAEAGIQGGVWG